MFKETAGEITFQEMLASTYETKFWEVLGGYNEDVDLDLAEINAIETARKNGHSPAKLAQIVKSSMS